jgi:MscS family membrane protein
MINLKMLRLSLKAKRIVAIFLFATLGIVLLVGSPMLTKTNIKLNLKHEHREVNYIPFEDQPIYETILEKQQEEARSIIDAAAVTSPMPANTVASFYARMASLYDDLIPYYTHPQAYPGFFWDADSKQHFRLISEELTEVAKALDVSLLPESIRQSEADHRSMQLKQIFDYIFANATAPIAIEDQPKQGLWEFPQSPITLIDAVTTESKLPVSKEYQFTTDTVNGIPELYELIKADQPTKEANKLYSPDFYRLISETPGRLIAPKWYLELPPSVRNVADIAFGENTLVQIILAGAIVLAYALITLFVFLRFSRTYSKNTEQKLLEINSKGWISLQDREAWQRLILLCIFLIATQVASVQISEYANITGVPMVLIQYVFSFILYGSLSFSAFLLLEAIGRIICDAVIAISVRLTMEDLSRVAGSVMPASRLIGLLLSIYFVYKLLLSLGLPGSTILAFSTVPGLAIGLGASKMLGNLMAGFVIQTDRPIQVGDFCEIAGNKGFVTSVGLRSIRLDSAKAKITIPNSKVDETNVVNYMLEKMSVDGSKLRVYGIDLSEDLQLIHAPEGLDAIRVELNDFLSNQRYVESFELKVKPSLVGSPAHIACKVSTVAKNWKRTTRL